MRNKIIMIGNHPYLEIRCERLHDDVYELSQISYEKNGRMKIHGTIIVKEWTLQTILNKKEAKRRRNK